MTMYQPSAVAAEKCEEGISKIVKVRIIRYHEDVLIEMAHFPKQLDRKNGKDEEDDGEREPMFREKEC